MTDTKTNGARDAKGNLIPKEVWVTCYDLPGHDHPYLMGVSAKPWDYGYDAPITKWASNVRYMPADLLADMTRQRDEAILMCELAQDKQNELLDTIERTRRQRDEAWAEGFAAGLKAASDLMTQWANDADGNIDPKDSAFLNFARAVERDFGRGAAEMILRIKEGAKP